MKTTNRTTLTAVALVAAALMMSPLSYAGSKVTGTVTPDSKSNPAQLPFLVDVFRPNDRTMTPPLGVENITANGHALLYPNPAHDQIMLAGLNGEISYRVMDISGKLMASRTINPSDANVVHTIDISQLQQGMYLLYLESKNSKETLRFVVQ
jgi:hypothetical protein